MQTVVKLNDKTLEHKDGLIYVDNLNETLDSGIVVCESIDRLDITPLDKFDIKFPNVNYERAMIVSSFNEEVASYNPPKYNYAIQYVSPVLLTERITLPNLTIKRVYKTKNDEDWLVKENGYYSRSVAYYIYQYMNEYFDLGEWMLSAELELLAMDKICPEMSFDRPNLKEVMNALLQSLDLIFYIDMIKSGDKYVYIIKGLNPNIEGNPIDTSKLDRDVIQQSVNYYASNLDIELTNSISNKTTKSIQYLTPRTDDAILTSDNAKLILQNSIYDIDKVEVNVGIIEFAEGIINKWIDITDHIVEKSVYEGLKTAKVITAGEKELYKQNTLYFTQGDNVIEGLYNVGKFVGILNTNPTLSIILSAYTEEIGVALNKSNLGKIVDAITNYYDRFMFRITYRTQQDVKMQTEKVIKTKHKSSLFDSQDSKFVNVELFSKNSLNTINKLGNPERTINAVYTNYNDIPQLGDYIDDYVLTNRTISIYDDYVVFEGNLTKDFAYKYQFNAIDSKKRFYNISDETLVRHELIKKYCVFDFVEDEYINEDIVLASNLILFANLKCNYATLKFDYGNNAYSDLLLSEVNTYQEANSVGLTFGFNNNIVAGNTRGEKDTGGYYQEPVKYVNEYGENYGVEINLYTDMVEKNFTSQETYLEYAENKSANFPKLETAGGVLTNNIYTINTTKHKDQSEIQRWTIQFTFVSNNERIILGNAYYENNAFLNSNTQDNFKIFKYNKKFNIRNIDELDSSSIIEENVLDYIFWGDNYYQFNISGNIGLKVGNKLFLGINDYVAGTKIYLNIKNNR